MSSFKTSSTEEEPTIAVRPRDHGPGGRRPVSWGGYHQAHGRYDDGHDDVIDSVKRKISDERVRYDADDEHEIGGEGVNQEVKVQVHEEYQVTRRRRPTSLHGVTSQYPEMTSPSSSHRYQRKYEKRNLKNIYQNSGRRRSTKYMDNHLKRKLPLGYISNSDVPKPYQSLETHPLHHVKRRRSEDLVEEDNLNNEASLRLRDSKDRMVERVIQVQPVIVTPQNMD